MLVVHPLAREEMAAAIDHYAAISPDLATRIADEIDCLVDEIQSSPESFAFYEPLAGRRRWRRRLATGFPYLMVYEVIGDTIRVVSFSHAAQRPGYWVDR